MMNSMWKNLMASKPVILDGAWGTQLQARGLPVGACPDLWNTENPDAVRSVAQAYVDAGSQVILTNTFGANRLILERHGAGDRAEEISRIGAELSRRAAGDAVRVFGSIGPSGRMLLMEEVTAVELECAFQEQARGLRDGGADAIVVETQTDVQEARIAAEAALTTGLPVVVSFVFDATPNGVRTMMGASVADAVAALVPLGISALGANCGSGLAAFPDIVRELRAASDLPVWAKPNAGQPKWVDGNAVYDLAPEAFAKGAGDLAQLGATFIGGCCGSSPELIRALARRFDATDKTA